MAAACVSKAGIAKPKSLEDILAVPAASLPLFNALFTGNKDCKIAFAKSITAFTRGTVCAMCAGTDKLANYFDGAGKLIINQ